MTTDETDSSTFDINKATTFTPLTREALYALVWSEPMLKVAMRYDVSSSYMARVCTFLNVPRPACGYWSKVKVGNAPPIPPLPDARPGDELVWLRDRQHIKVNRQLLRPPSTPTKKSPRSTTPKPSQHPLIDGAKAHFETGRLSYEAGYLKPAKKLLVDLVVSKTGLDKALSFATELFLSFEAKGHRVVIAPNGEHFYRAEVDEHEEPRKNRGCNNLWSPYRCTVVYIGTVAIGLTIIELSEEVEVRYVNGKYIREKDYIPPKRGRYAFDHSWTTKQDFPTGRLCLQAYSPYPRAKWVKRWQATKGHDLNSQIRTIVKELEGSAVDITHLVEEGQRQAEIELKKWEAQQEQWRREEAERLAVKALKESREELRNIIYAWVESNRIENFFQDAERKASALSEDERLRVLDRLKRAREMVGSIDALDHFLFWKSPDERSSSSKR